MARHSHSVDALYYIVSGSLKLGTEWMGAGDGFWLSGDTPYTYTAGPEGLEIVAFGAPNTGLGDAKQQMGWWAETD